MAKRMSLRCVLCNELVAAVGRERTIAVLAQHVRRKHRGLTASEREELARRPVRPQPLASALMAEGPPAS